MAGKAQKKTRKTYLHCGSSITKQIKREKKNKTEQI